jgi:hypothetical protein
LTTLRHLAEEICVGLQIYVAGRRGPHLKTAFVLCDDYTELATKMYLIRTDKTWKDEHNGRFKGYRRVLDDLQSQVSQHRQGDAATIEAIHGRMKARRDRRNVFFHSTTLLDLSVTPRDTAEALVDLLDYCELLFSDWPTTVPSVADLEALSLLVRLDAAMSRDGTLFARVSELFENLPRNRRVSKQKGTQLAVFPEDLHALLSVRWGGDSLKESLRHLLDE